MKRGSKLSEFPDVNIRLLAKHAGIRPEAVLPDVQHDHLGPISGRVFVGMTMFPIDRAHPIPWVAHRIWEKFRADVIDERGTTFESALRHPSITSGVAAIEQVMRIFTATGDLRRTVETWRDEAVALLLELDALEAVEAGR